MNLHPGNATYMLINSDHASHDKKSSVRATLLQVVSDGDHTMCPEPAEEIAVVLDEHGQLKIDSVVNQGSSHAMPGSENVSDHATVALPDGMDHLDSDGNISSVYHQNEDNTPTGKSPLLNFWHEITSDGMCLNAQFQL